MHRGDKRYSKDEILFIKTNFDKMTVEEIADKLGRTPKGVRSKINLMGIHLSDIPRNEPHKWTEKHVQIKRSKRKWI